MILILFVHVNKCITYIILRLNCVVFMARTVWCCNLKLVTLCMGTSTQNTFYLVGGPKSNCMDCFRSSEPLCSTLIPLGWLCFEMSYCGWTRLVMISFKKAVRTGFETFIVKVVKHIQPWWLSGIMNSKFK